jgi:sensor histidine kinase regulating citrate/malate metabolism
VAYTRPDQSPVGLFNVAQTLKDMGGSAEVSLTAEGLTRFRLSVPVECDL